MSDNHWETQPRKKNGEFTYRKGKGQIYSEVFNQALKEIEAETLKGGSYGELRKITAGSSVFEIHHMPADSVSPLSHWKGTCIIMYKKDHVKTSSYGNKKKASLYRQKQREFIKKGQFLEAEWMDINEIRELFGTKYDKAINEKLTYEQRLESEGKINEKS